MCVDENHWVAEAEVPLPQNKFSEVKMEQAVRRICRVGGRRFFCVHLWRHFGHEATNESPVANMVTESAAEEGVFAGTALGEDSRSGNVGRRTYGYFEEMEGED